MLLWRKAALSPRYAYAFFRNVWILRIILKWILNKWNEFVWVTIGASGRLDFIW